MAGENEVDLDHPAIKAAITIAVETSVSCLKTKNSELLGKLKETAGKLTQFETQLEGESNRAYQTKSALLGGLEGLTEKWALFCRS